MGPFTVRGFVPSTEQLSANRDTVVRIFLKRVEAYAAQPGLYETEHDEHGVRILTTKG